MAPVIASEHSASGTTAEDLPQQAPSVAPVIVSQPLGDSVVEAVQDHITEPRMTEDESQPANHEPQVQPTSEQAASENPSTPTTTVPPPDNSTPATLDVDRDTDHSIPTPTRAGVFQLEGSLSFVTMDTIKYWEAIPGGQRWVDMVSAYLRLEHLSVSKTVRTRLLVSMISR